MCVVSMVSDHYRDRWGNPDWNPGRWHPRPDWAVGPTPDMETGPTQTEFNKLKREVEEMKELLKRAVKYDKETGQPHCEQDEKSPC